MNLQKHALSKLRFPASRRTSSLIFENPTDNSLRVDATETVITVTEYNATDIKVLSLSKVQDCATYANTDKRVWINVDGLRRTDVAALCDIFHIHQLIQEDIISRDQRPKSDIFEDFAYVLLYQLYFEEKDHELKREQISIIFGKNFVLTFQEEATRDAFAEVRKRLQNKASKVREAGSDFLFYALFDAIVDDYFETLDVYGEKIETLESEIIRTSAKMRMSYILFLRRELLLFRRTVYPARDVISSLNKNENGLFNAKTLRYLKDIYDHILQASEMLENYREGMSNLQDLHMNQANLKMNESMKVMAIVTCLLAPATVIGGVFGMNFTHFSLLHYRFGLICSVTAMLLIPIWMIYIFKKRGWF